MRGMPTRRPQSRDARRRSLSGFLEVGDHIGQLRRSLDARKFHLGLGHFRLGVLEIVSDARLVPGNAGGLHGVRRREAWRTAGLAADHAEQIWPERAGRALLDGMAGLAL